LSNCDLQELMSTTKKDRILNKGDATLIKKFLDKIKNELKLVD